MGEGGAPQSVEEIVGETLVEGQLVENRESNFGGEKGRVGIERRPFAREPEEPDRQVGRAVASLLESEVPMKGRQIDQLEPEDRHRGGFPLDGGKQAIVNRRLRGEKQGGAPGASTEEVNDERSRLGRIELPLQEEVEVEVGRMMIHGPEGRVLGGQGIGKGSRDGLERKTTRTDD
jgi:hypothetical protein